LFGFARPPRLGAARLPPIAINSNRRREEQEAVELIIESQRDRPSSGGFVAVDQWLLIANGLMLTSAVQFSC
jgi:hypothetical protein